MFLEISNVMPSYIKQGVHVFALSVIFKVCDKQFPPCALTEEDLIKNPYFSKLLLSLSQHVDESGLSLALAKEQAQVRPLGGGMAGRGESLRERNRLRRVPFCFEVWSEVRLRKTAWLRYEILQRVIQELLVDYYVKAQDTNLTSEDKKVRQRNKVGVRSRDENNSASQLWQHMTITQGLCGCGKS